MSKKREILVKAKELIATPEQWTKGHFGRDAEGNQVDLDSDACVGRCLMGAVYRAQRILTNEAEPEERFGYSVAVRDAVVQLNECLPADAVEGQWANIPEFNDYQSTTHADVIAVIDCALEKTQE